MYYYIVTGFIFVISSNIFGSISIFECVNNIYTQYRSPNSSDENNAKLLEVLSNVTELKYSHVTIMGDLNYPDVDWSDNISHSGLNHPATTFIETILSTEGTNPFQRKPKCQYTGSHPLKRRRYGQRYRI